MLTGIIYALGACFIWGFIFVIPQFMAGFSCFEIAIGRYLCYGGISSLLFFKSLKQKSCLYSKAIWFKAAYFSLVTTIGYYTCLVLALRYSSAAICALILGISPIAIAFYGNWQQKETNYRNLILPSLFILVGLIVINYPHLENSASRSYYLLGLMFCILSLSGWSWYVVANSKFLKNHPLMGSSDWSTLMGVMTLFWVVILSMILFIFFEDQVHLEKFFTFNAELKGFILGSLILGLLCSWMGGFLWNRATLHLPVSLAGQLTIFETIFGVVFVYIVAQKLPSINEVIGIVILLAAITYGIRIFAKREKSSTQVSIH